MINKLWNYEDGLNTNLTMIFEANIQNKKIALSGTYYELLSEITALINRSEIIDENLKKNKVS